jgi:hypothetical protein
MYPALLHVGGRDVMYRWCIGACLHFCCISIVGRDVHLHCGLMYAVVHCRACQRASDNDECLQICLPSKLWSWLDVAVWCREVWADGVQKLVAYNDERGDLGTIFLDLFQRSGKFSGCAQYTILCGKALPDGTCRLPIVALCCSFDKEHAQLTYDQV